MRRGSGIYSLSGRTLQVYRLPFGYALPRVGFGYRFGDDLSVYRVVFGSPY